MRAILMGFLAAFIVGAASGQTIKEGKFRIEHEKDGSVSVRYAGKTAFGSVRAGYSYDGREVTTNDYDLFEMVREDFSDVHGRGVCYTVTYYNERLPEFERRYFLYPDKDYFFVQASVIAFRPGIIDVADITPFSCAEPSKNFSGRNSRMLFVPFDNDKWVRFDVMPPSDMTSYEVTALFNTVSRAGWVLGSVSHDTWKTGVKTTVSDGRLSGIECVAGVTSTLTRDTLPHGVVRGRVVSSPKIMIGHFSDWRQGMEEFAMANRRVAPSPAWDGGVPFGYNSWGSIQSSVNYDKMAAVSDFFRDNLQNKGFSNDGTVYIGIDSYWDNFSDDQLKAFVEHCKRNGQKAGIYWAPFVDWARRPGRIVEGTQDTPYKDVYLYANGKPQELDGAWAIDPTHPAVQKRIDYFTGRFKRAGFEYIKIDFVTHGSLEADSHYDPSVTTGMQAYNFGMDYFRRAIGDDFYITVAISPLFPSQYVHSRRIACDAFASISDTEYTLNGLSYGWWLGDAYLYNDPDHIVLRQKDETEGENRARVTSGVITGLLMAGDDFSDPGDAVAKERALRFYTNPAVNAIARKGRSFRPVYGYMPSVEKRSEDAFMLNDGDTTYVALFNFTDSPLQKEIPVELLGLDKKRARKAVELWEGETAEVKGALRSMVPARDARLWVIY